METLKIYYEVDGNMVPNMIANDKSLHFYIVLKRKESSLTTYALRVDVACTLMAALCEPDRHQCVTHSTFFREKGVASGN